MSGAGRVPFGGSGLDLELLADRRCVAHGCSGCGCDESGVVAVVVVVVEETVAACNFTRAVWSAGVYYDYDLEL